MNPVNNEAIGGARDVQSEHETQEQPYTSDEFSDLLFDRPLLGEKLEAPVMLICWRAKEPVTVRDVLQELRDEARKPNAEHPEHADIQYTTLMTTMSRLAKKGYLTEDSSTVRGYKYFPTISYEQFGTEEVGRIIRALKATHPQEVVRYLIGIM